MTRGKDHYLIVIMCMMLSMTSMLSAGSFRDNLLNQPESVAYYEAENLYLVSNWASGEIIAIDDNGEQSYFNQELESVAGIKIYNEKLFCCATDQIAIIDLQSRQVDTLITVSGSALLNDLVFYNQYLYISDYWDPKIYRMNLEDYSYEIFYQASNFVPNGMYFDEENGVILCVVRNENGSQPRVVAINPEDASTALVVNTPYYSLDGIARDSEGNYYLSSWYMGQGVQGIFKYNSDFSNTPEVISTDCDGPADIFIHNNILAIPNLNANSVDFTMLQPISQHDVTVENLKEFYNYPNPFNPDTNIVFSLDKADDVKIRVFNSKGQLLKILCDQFYSSGSHSVPFHSDTLASGIYFYQIQNSQQTITKKMMIVK
ncbi:MAG TPA: T9SS type A sorting domain-containing protein [Candidatus Cloacimonadota bacterium]|nr:T9SS type A sorting domain-containing protein [Candidatus Cloacimonadota bacterium]